LEDDWVSTRAKLFVCEFVSGKSFENFVENKLKESKVAAS